MIKHPRAKGNAVQLKLIKELEDAGWLVAKVEQHGKFIKVKDMYGLFDLLAIHRNGDVRFIQVTCSRPHKHGLYEVFSKTYAKTYIDVYQYVWIKYKGWKVFQYVNGIRCLEE